MKLSAGEVDAIIAGCEGVTPGPWEWIDEGAYLCGAADSDGFVELIITTDLGHYGPHGPDAAHIARLDPATVLALAELALDGLSYRAVMAEIDALADKARKTETHSGTDE